MTEHQILEGKKILDILKDYKRVETHLASRCNDFGKRDNSHKAIDFVSEILDESSLRNLMTQGIRKELAMSALVAMKKHASEMVEKLEDRLEKM